MQPVPSNAERKLRVTFDVRQCRVSPTEERRMHDDLDSLARQVEAFPVADLPEMEKGRGNLIFGIPGRKSRAGEELMVAATVIAPEQSAVVWSGERKMTLSWKDLQHYLGARGQRGAVLPRGWRKVDRLGAE